MRREFPLNYQRAVIFATRAHAGQVRKYTEEPYMVHPLSVAYMVTERLFDMHDPVSIDRSLEEETVMAAVLHDVLEDTEATEADLISQFGIKVLDLVVELTDVYTSEAYPHENRATRKGKELQRLSMISPEAALVKICDIADNTKDIVANSPKFATVYLPEKAAILKIVEPKITPDAALRK